MYNGFAICLFLIWLSQGNRFVKRKKYAKQITMPIVMTLMTAGISELE